MQRVFHKLMAAGILALVVVAQGMAMGASDALAWRGGPEGIDADIKGWDLRRLLQNMAADTGWQIYLDPGASHDVSVKFKGLDRSEALKALLGDVNFMLVSETNGASKLFVFRRAREQATLLIPALVRTPAKPIPNELIVTLKPGSKVDIDKLAKSLGGKVIGKIPGLNAYLLQFDNQTATDAAHDALASNPDVASVDYNYSVERPPPMAATGAVAGSMPSLQIKPPDNNGACPLVVGLVDTAVQPLGNNLDSFMQPKLQVAGDYTPDPTQITHGTAMAETILDAIQSKTGGSSSVRIQSVDVYGANTTTSTFDVANGIVQAVNHGADIINLSLGSSGDSQVLRNVINQVEQQGIPIYAAAGNTPVTTATYPAAYPGVVAVTASDPSGNIASYANRGSFVDMMISGDNVVPFNGQSYMVEGTSTSTAFASGMAAGLADANHDCATQAAGLLKQSIPQKSR